MTGFWIFFETAYIAEQGRSRTRLGDKLMPLSWPTRKGCWTLSPPKEWPFTTCPVPRDTATEMPAETPSTGSMPGFSGPKRVSCALTGPQAPMPSRQPCSRFLRPGDDVLCVRAHLTILLQPVTGKDGLGDFGITYRETDCLLKYEEGHIGMDSVEADLLSKREKQHEESSTSSAPGVIPPARASPWLRSVSSCGS
jgi:hypothetical protein